MKYKIDKQVLDNTKTLILSVKSTLQHLYNREQNFDRKVLISGCISCLNQSHENLDKHAKEEIIRKMFITTKQQPNK